MINYFSKIYYINLDIDTNKKLYFLNQINSSLLKNYYNRLSAINGYNINLELVNNTVITDYARSCILDKKQKNYGVSLTYGSLGCALSHKLLFENCAKDTGPYLIFEDDAILCDNFDDKLSELVHHISNIDYDMIYLGYNEIQDFHKNYINSVLSKPNGLITGLYGYIVSTSGAQKLLNNIFPLNVQIDSSISHNQDRLKLFCSTHPLVKANLDFGSKTQNLNSCNNIYTNDNWYKLFL